MRNKEHKGRIAVLVSALCIALSIVGSGCKKQETLTMDSASNESSDPLRDKGIGPIKEVKLGEIDSALADKGAKVFQTKCMACHSLEKRVVGPALKGVTKRRSPEWIMNMILNTNEMVKKNAIVQSMIAVYMTKMTFQDVNEAEARSLLEFFRKHDSAAR